MANKIDLEEYKRVHEGDLRRLLSIYWLNKPFWKNKIFWVALLFTAINVITMEILKTPVYGSLEFLSDKIISIMPNILGFNLGGYVLLIGLNSQSILDEITEPIKAEKYSLFQKQSSVFAFSILIQALAILIGFSVLNIMHISKGYYFSESFATGVNVFALFLLTFISFYSLLLIIKIIVNIFNFGQTLHFYVRLERLEKQNKAEEKK